MVYVVEWKKKEVEEFVNIIKSYLVIVFVDVVGVLVYLFSKMCDKFCGKVFFRVSRNIFIEFVIKRVVQEFGQLEFEKFIDYIQGGVVIFVIEMNLFKFYKFFEESKILVFVKVGVVVLKDVVIFVGLMLLVLGLFVGEMQVFGILVRIEKGKVSIQKDYIVFKVGEVIIEQFVRIFNVFGIELFEVGFNLFVVYEDGIVYILDVFVIDESEYINMFQKVYMYVFNLLVNIVYLIKQIIEVIFQKVYFGVKNVVVEVGYIIKDIVEDIFGRVICVVLFIVQNLFEDLFDEKIKEFLNVQV